jgi:hypothetical protein
MTVSRIGMTPKMKSGPQNQSRPEPVRATSPHAMNGSSGTRRPSSHA